MKDFINFLIEDGAVAAAPAGGNVTAGVQNYESPIGSKQPTAGVRKRGKNGQPIIPDPAAPKIQEEYEPFPGFDIPNIEYSLRMNQATHLNLSDYVALSNDMGANGIAVHALDADPRSLKPTQRNFNWEKVNNLKDTTGYLNPIIISEDGYIIDGHHRWLAACADEAPIIAARMVKLGIVDALKWLKGKEYPRNNDIQEGERYVPGVGHIGGASDEYPDEYDINKNGEWMPNAKYYMNKEKDKTKYTSRAISGLKIEHFHQVEYDKKEDAKKEGMKWDSKEKGWFHTHLSKSQTSQFPYVKSVRYEKIDPLSDKLNRTEWVRPQVDGSARDAFTYDTQDHTEAPEGSVKDDQGPDEQNLQFVHDVSYMSKENAKKEGMKWDPVEKHWYHVDGEKSKSSSFPYKKTVPNK